MNNQIVTHVLLNNQSAKHKILVRPRKNHAPTTVRRGINSNKEIEFVPSIELTSEKLSNATVNSPNQFDFPTSYPIHIYQNNNINNSTHRNEMYVPFTQVFQHIFCVFQSFATNVKGS